MIGQKRNIELIDKWVSKGCPHFICIIGDKGSGKTMLSSLLATKLNLPLIKIGIKVDDIREMKSTALKSKGVYLIKDADNMSVNAKNAILKIVEESPKDAYFIMTLQYDSSLMETLRSRAQIIRVHSYSSEELFEYGCKYTNTDTLKYMISIANTPYELDKLMEYGKDFIDFVNLVIDNIQIVEPANAFKSGLKLDLKDTGDKYDVNLFFNTFIDICITKMQNCDDSSIYAQYIIITASYLVKLRQMGVNMQQIYDRWIMDIRSV